MSAPIYENKTSGYIIPSEYNISSLKFPFGYKIPSLKLYKFSEFWRKIQSVIYVEVQARSEVLSFSSFFEPFEPFEALELSIFSEFFKIINCLKSLAFQNS